MKMEWIILRDIIRDYGNLGTIALILLLWQWTKHQFEKLNIRLEEIIKRLDKRQEFNDVIKTFENPLSEQDKKKLREYIDKILKES